MWYIYYITNTLHAMIDTMRRTRDSAIALTIILVLFGFLYECEVLYTLAIPMGWYAVYYIAKHYLVINNRYD